jgi:hypothetical protein
VVIFSGALPYILTYFSKPSRLSALPLAIGAAAYNLSLVFQIQHRKTNNLITVGPTLSTIQQVIPTTTSETQFQVVGNIAIAIHGTIGILYVLWIWETMVGEINRKGKAMLRLSQPHHMPCKSIS